jgi:hypothetical protein
MSHHIQHTLPSCMGATVLDNCCLKIKKLMNVLTQYTSAHKNSCRNKKVCMVHTKVSTVSIICVCYYLLYRIAVLVVATTTTTTTSTVDQIGTSTSLVRLTSCCSF